MDNDLLIQLGTDVKWLIEQAKIQNGHLNRELAEIKTHLIQLNGTIDSHATALASHSTWIIALRWIIGGVVIALLALLGFVLSI